MKFVKQDNNDFVLTGTAESVMKVRDELESAWDADDDFVAELTSQLAGHDDNSQEEVSVTFEMATVGDAIDVLEHSEDAEVREAAENCREAMEAHNTAVLDEAERAATE